METSDRLAEPWNREGWNEIQAIMDRACSESYFHSPKKRLKSGGGRLIGIG